MKSKTAPVRAPKARKKKKILLVDDDTALTRVLAELLDHAGYDAIQASYSLPALFEVVRQLPDLILVDINMPIMNGLELVEQFKSYEETRHVPIVVMTGMDTPQAREVVRELGCVGFLPKPIDGKKFPAQVAKFLRA